MWLFNTIPEKLAANKQYSRKQMLCHQFMQLIREHSTCEHQVPFYTEQLCITSRYLYEITTQYMNGKTPKQLIDHYQAKTNNLQGELRECTKGEY